MRLAATAEFVRLAATGSLSFSLVLLWRCSRLAAGTSARPTSCVGALFSGRAGVGRRPKSLMHRNAMPRQLLRIIQFHDGSSEPRRGADGCTVELQIKLRLVDELGLFRRDFFTARGGPAPGVPVRLHLLDARFKQIPDAALRVVGGHEGPPAFHGDNKLSIRFTFAAGCGMRYVLVEKDAAAPAIPDTVLALVAGPFGNDTDETVRFEAEPHVTYGYRRLLDRGGVLAPPYLIVREALGSGIACKVWDSAVFALEQCRRSVVPGGRRMRVLDLGAGTGVVGLGCGMMMDRQGAGGEVLLAELPEALGLLQENGQRLAPLLQRTRVDVCDITWGRVGDVEKVGALDLVIACDLIYEMCFLPDLLFTLDLLCRPGHTVIIIGYKDRGLSREQSRMLMCILAEYFDFVEIAMPEAAAYGVHLWQLSRSHALSCGLLAARMATSPPTEWISDPL